ncbi:MAG: hypothetical protein Q7O66_00890 [Dehalococcoidia bacterium]|nr:hypothetical protein [Dehalococcoidia bacterium]
MTRVAELQKKYPDLAREVIIKWETLRYGIKDSDALYKAGLWRRAAGGFLSLDHGVTMEEIAKKRPESVRPGYVLLPGVYYMKNGIGSRIERDPSSPYEIREDGPGQFALYEGEEKIVEVYFNNPKHWTDDPEKEPRTSKGTPVTSLVTLLRRCFQIAPLRYCQYFDLGTQCKFCNYNSTHDSASAIGGSHRIALDLEDTVEAYKILSSETRLVEGRYQSGAISNDEKEANMQIRFVESVSNAASYTPNFCMSTPPVSRKNMQRLKDAGLTSVGFNLEVWEPQIHAEVCPGKATYRTYEGYLEAYAQAIDVWGIGNVACNFVGGVSMMPPNGHKSWQESRDSMIEGFGWLIKTGVFPTFHCLRLGAGSIYGEERSNEAKLPPTEYFLDVGLAHHQFMLDYGRYYTLNRLMICPMDCLAHFYAGEIGMLALAGNPANWLANTIPNEYNWMVKFISSVDQSTRPTVKAQ